MAIRGSAALVWPNCEAPRGPFEEGDEQEQRGEEVLKDRDGTPVVRSVQPHAEGRVQRAGAVAVVECVLDVQSCLLVRVLKRVLVASINCTFGQERLRG